GMVTEEGEVYLQGGIEALRIWSRALTNTEVCDLYQSDLVPPDGLVAQYLLDEGGGTVAVDTSGGNNNATIYGAAWMSGQNVSAAQTAYNGTPTVAIE